MDDQYVCEKKKKKEQTMGIIAALALTFHEASLANPQLGSCLLATSWATQSAQECIVSILLKSSSQFFGKTIMGSLNKSFLNF